MTSSRDRVDLARWWKTSTSASCGEDYKLLGRLGVGFAGRDRAGRPALVVPLALPAAGAVGRAAAGCELVGRPSLRFEWEGRSWDESAAILTCTDPDLVDAFAVFVADILSRLGSEATWVVVVGAVEEWTLLLSPRGRPSPEHEAGLWAELWFIVHATDLDRLISGWRGPEGDATDFFVDGHAVDIKASTVKRQHHVSETQVGRAAGDRPAHLLSVWLKSDPLARWSVPMLVDDVLERTVQPAEALKKIARAGFSMADRAVFTQRYAILAEPEWYPTETVPRVRAADRGVSQLRYRIDLEDIPRAGDADARALWQHFARQPYRSP